MMINAVSSSALAGARPVEPLGINSPGAADSGFASVLRNAIQRIETSGAEAEKAAEGFLSGTSTDVHSAALAAQRASLQFEYVLQVRNKVVSAYQEIMRMQL